MTRSASPLHPRLLQLCTVLLAACLGVSAAHAQYLSAYGPPPASADNVSSLKTSGWTEYILFATDVNAAGDLTSATPAVPFVTNGVYVGASSYPTLAQDLTTIKQGSISRVTIGIDSSSFPSILTLVNSTNTDPTRGAVGGAGPASSLYKTFAALKAALPVDARPR